MARSDAEAEPALLWSIALFMAAIAALGRLEFAAYEYTANPALPWALRGLAGAFALLGFGMAGAMGEPLPADPREGSIPLRLRLCWGILGVCPRPGKALRTSAAAAVAALYLFPFGDVGPFGLTVNTALLVGGLMVAKPKRVAESSAFELLYLLGLAGVGLGALGGTFSDGLAESWRSLFVLAALVPLAGQRAREVCAARWAELLPGVPPPPALDLSRYEVQVERQAPAQRPALPEGTAEQLVDTGTFRVDAAKMLDKLRSYQLSDPRDFLSAWLRCAAASGARNIRLESGATSLELAFDGRAFSSSELAQPYQALVDAEGENGKRGRHFAYGLLGLYRLKPLSVSVTSRGPDGVAAMKAGDAGTPLPESALDGTVVRVTWPFWAAYWRPALIVRRARLRYGLGPAALTVNGRAVPDRPAGRSWHALEKDGWRAAANVAERTGRVRLYVLGTLIEEMEYRSGGADAWLAHDELELDISQSSVVRGARLSKGLDLLVARLG